MPTMPGRKRKARPSVSSGETPSSPTHASGEGSITKFLRERIGIRGDISLLDEAPGGIDLSVTPCEGRYSILGEIARGGMGAIVKIVDNDVRRPVAMKVVLGGDEDETLDRFIEEAQITGQLEHPNIVPVHELGMNEEGKVYFTMKLVKGISLESLLNREAAEAKGLSDRTPLARLLEIFLKVSDAVAFAHSKGVIHRDLKPENIMVGNFGEVLVMDWGLAKVEDREDVTRGELVDSIRSERETGRTLDGEVVGTPSYMPPEQANGEVDEIDTRSDVFALGGILYKILTYQAPYSGSTVDAVLRKAVLRRLIRPRERAPANAVPRELEAICLKAMAERKSQRYGSVGALADDVRAFLAHRLVKAHRYGLYQRFVRFLQRHPTGSLASGVGLVMLAVGSAVVGILAGEARVARALEGEAEAKAALATRKRKKAETEKKVAESERDTARDLLEKGRKVSGVLRTTQLELGEVKKALKRNFFAWKPIEEKRSIAALYWKKVEAFEGNIERDAASQAAWLALKGDLRLLAGYTEEGMDLFKEAVRTDRDVAYGFLFESMAWLSKYLVLQPLPELKIGFEGVDFEPVPKETPEMAEARRKFEALLGAVEGCGVWGESASSDFKEVLDGFRGMQEGNLSIAERGLSKALAVPEMAWNREEFLWARAKVRYLRKEFQKGIQDMEKVLEIMPEFLEGYYYLGSLWDGEGVKQRFLSRDARSCFRNALKAYRKMREMDPQDLALHLYLGNTYTFLGMAQRDRGEDPTESFERAIASYTELRRVPEEQRKAVFGRGRSYYDLAETKAFGSQEALKAYRSAVEDFSEAIRIDPRNPHSYSSRAGVFVRIGDALAMRGENPMALYEKALSDTASALERDPKDLNAFRNRAKAHVSLANFAQARAQDPRDHLLKAIEACDEGLKVLPDSLPLLLDRGSARKDLGLSERARNRPAKELLDGAVADNEKILEQAPEFLPARYNVAVGYLNLGVLEKDGGRDPGPFFQKARGHLQNALELDPGFWRATATLGIIAYNEGDFGPGFRGNPGDPRMGEGPGEPGGGLSKGRLQSGPGAPGGCPGEGEGAESLRGSPFRLLLRRPACQSGHALLPYLTGGRGQGLGGEEARPRGGCRSEEEGPRTSPEGNRFRLQQSRDGQEEPRLLPPLRAPRIQGADEGVGREAEEGVA
jgi:tetratricopeptide (TPR) repeat protein